MRECGLKYMSVLSVRIVFVTPYAGVWIEINSTQGVPDLPNVTPYAGVWIEIP